MYALTSQFKYVFRKLAKSPGFAVVSILTMALAIGANTAIFSVINGVLLKPLPFDEPERLVGVWHKAPGFGFDLMNQSPALHFTYVDNARAFEDVGMWDNTTIAVTGLEEPEKVEAMRVTDRVFPLLRVNAHVGRTFTAEEDAPGSPETVVLAYKYWTRQFGGDAKVIGQTLRIDGLRGRSSASCRLIFAFFDTIPTSISRSVSIDRRLSSATSAIRALAD